MQQQSPVAPAAVQPVELSYVSLAGSEVPAATRENVHLLQQAADYQTHSQSLRRSAIAGIIIGLIWGVVGYLMIDSGQPGYALVVFAVVLVGIGAWLVSAPSPLGMLVDGIAMIAVGAINVILFILSLQQVRNGQEQYTFGIIFSIIMIGYGISRIVSYPKYKAAAAMSPSPQTLKWLKDLTKDALNTRAKNDVNTVEFTRSTFFNQEKGRVRLLPEVAVFVAEKNQTYYIGGGGGVLLIMLVRMMAGKTGDVRLVSRDGLSILSEKKVLLGKSYKVKMRVNAKEQQYIIPQESLMRLKAWLGQPAVVGARGFDVLMTGADPAANP